MTTKEAPGMTPVYANPTDLIPMVKGSIPVNTGILEVVPKSKGPNPKLYKVPLVLSSQAEFCSGWSPKAII